MKLRRRLTNETEIPDHFEAVPLRAGILMAGWIFGPSLTVAGVAAMVGAEGTTLEGVGAACAAVGCLMIFAIVRCRRFELELGRRWLRVGAGPLRHRVPAESITEVVRSSARSWRRFYAKEELRVSLGAGMPELVVPTGDDEETMNALREKVCES